MLGSATASVMRWAPDARAGFGTWYLATHPRSAFAEVFGRSRIIDRAQIDGRVLAQVFLPSDLRLADLTHPTVLVAPVLLAS